MEAPGARGASAGAESQVARLEGPTQKLSQTRRAARWTRLEVSILQLFLGILGFDQDHQDVTAEIGPPRTSQDLAGPPGTSQGLPRTS